MLPGPAVPATRLMLTPMTSGPSLPGNGGMPLPSGASTMLAGPVRVTSSSNDLMTLTRRSAVFSVSTMDPLVCIVMLPVSRISLRAMMLIRWVSTTSDGLAASTVMDPVPTAAPASSSEKL